MLGTSRGPQNVKEMVDGLGRPLPLGLVMAEFGLILIAACQMACAMTKALAILEPSPGTSFMPGHKPPQVTIAAVVFEDSK
jgi:hypothetical protein